MTTVTIRPMPEAIRKISKKFRPQHPPVFIDVVTGGVTAADIELARELFNILDSESQEWYGGQRFLDGLEKYRGDLKTKKWRRDQ